jgi:hypothetical protein
MFVEENPLRAPSLHIAFIVSLLLHGVILLIPRQAPESRERPAGRIEATLVPRPQVVPPPARKPTRQAAAKSPRHKNVLAVAKPKTENARPTQPTWSVAEKEEMNKFLQELEVPHQPAPDLAQRSLAMAREYSRQQARQQAEGSEMLELLPNSPPVNPFSLEMYLDALVKKLNRSADFVKNDPRSKGVRNALVQVRLNADGSLHSFKVLNAADQQGEISFIKAVVEQAVPFAAFPADLRGSARSLTMMICIRPPSLSGGFGFMRTPDGGRC